MKVELPNEIWLTVFGYLDARSVLRLREVNTHFWNLIEEGATPPPISDVESKAIEIPLWHITGYLLAMKQRALLELLEKDCCPLRARSKVIKAQLQGKYSLSQRLTIGFGLPLFIALAFLCLRLTKRWLDNALDADTLAVTGITAINIFPWLAIVIIYTDATPKLLELYGKYYKNAHLTLESEQLDRQLSMRIQKNYQLAKGECDGLLNQVTALKRFGVWRNTFGTDKKLRFEPSRVITKGSYDKISLLNNYPQSIAEQQQAIIKTYQKLNV